MQLALHWQSMAVLKHIESHRLYEWQFQGRYQQCDLRIISMNDLVTSYEHKLLFTVNMHDYYSLLILYVLKHSTP